jgi:hypothetical protein
MGLSTFAQTSKKTLNYQAVILDPKAIDIPGASIVGQPLNKGNVCLRFSLLNAQGGLDYEETQQVTTDEYGLVNVAIGAGAQAQASNSTSIYKSFDSVMWNSSVKSLKVSVSYDACSSFKQVSSQALNYTPYALYAEAVDYKNVRDAPTKLSQFSNDPGFLIPKDLDPLKADITSNTSQLATANQTIADNKKNSDATFLVVNQSLTSLDKQVSANTSTITTMNTKITDQQNQIVDNRNQITATSNSLNTQIGGLQGQLNTTNSTVSNLSGTAEVVSNKSTSVNLGGANPSDQLYPSQKAAKSYIDNAIYDAVGTGVPDATTLAAGKVKLAGDLGGTAMNPTVPALANKENSSNKSTSVQTDGTNDTKYPSVKAVKDYVDQATMGTALQATVDGKADKLSPTFTGTPTAPTPASTDNSTKLATTAFVQAATAGIALQAAVDAKANINSPTFTGTPTAPTPTLGDNSTKLATTAYVDAQVSAGAADATTTSKGIVKLTGDLGGSATSPTVPGLLLKEDVSNKSDAALGTSTTLYPTQNAVKTYVDAQVASATIADANATTKGKLQLTGDLGGTASSPTVPGLTTKANIASPTFTGTVTSPIYASAPQNLTDAATISWNPANGLNANVTLGGDRTLSFSATPTSGSYGTLVVTQDATGGRTLTLPSGTNKVLGSASTTTIALSSAANAKDILNFYYDGLTSTYYWNVGQGYGIAETVESTNLASAVTGTLPVANGGTGAATATAALTALGAQASANLSTDMVTDALSTTKYPAVKTIKDYVTSSVSTGAPDATSTSTGKIQLAGDLAGSSTSPLVVKLRGTSISTVAPITAGHVLTYDATGSGVAYWAAPANSANTISGVVPVANGGTGLSSVTSGGAVYASSSSALTTGTLPLTAGGTGATTAAAALTALGAAPLASPTFTGTVTTSTINTGALSATSVNTPIYASTPQTLTDAATISWNPTLGLNASVTLAGDRTLSFTSTPAVGSYGTLVVTQDATGGRTITLPTISNVTNKVLGSATNTTVSLSTAANAKDILNFYYDGTNCYWNTGQGYGTAASAPFTLTTTGTGAATLSGTTLNIPSVSSTVNSGSISGTIAVANGGTGVTTSTGTGNVVLSTSPTLITPALGTPSAVVLTSATGLPLTTGVTGTLAVGNGGTGASTLTGYVKGTGTTAMTASSNIPVADVTGAAPLASPTFTGTVTTSTINTGALSATSVNTPIYASTPQTLTDAATISWNPTLGLNANVTLAGDRTLSFTSTPAAGSYGTLVVTQDATGGRTLTLPSTANKVLGSSSTTTITLSTTANAKDILNFYYDGTNCYWNIGQGYGNAPTASFTLTTTGTGAATLSGTTLNIPSVSSTVNSGSISGTIAVANGGTGASTLSGLIKGNGTGAMTAAVAGTDYLVPTGSAASLTNFPTFNQNTTGNAATATLAGNITATTNTTLTSLSNLATVGTITTGVWSGTAISVANGGTGLTSTPMNGQIDIGNGSGFTRATLTAGTAITITNTAGAITIAAAIRPTTDEFTATAGQTAFTLSQTPLTNTTTSPVKLNVWMFINGVRTKNSAYAVSGTGVTYTASSNNNYTLVAGDRIQFDYVY